MKKVIYYKGAGRLVNSVQNKGHQKAGLDIKLFQVLVQRTSELIFYLSESSRYLSKYKVFVQALYHYANNKCDYCHISEIYLFICSVLVLFLPFALSSLSTMSRFIHDPSQTLPEVFVSLFGYFRV